MKTHAHALKWLLIGGILFGGGAVVAVVASVALTADAVRADELGLSGTPNILFVLAAIVGGVLGISGLMMIMVNFAKWRIAEENRRASP
jgi:hypothetical protein